MAFDRSQKDLDVQVGESALAMAQRVGHPGCERLLLEAQGREQAVARYGHVAAEAIFLRRFRIRVGRKVQRAEDEEQKSNCDAAPLTREVLFNFCERSFSQHPQPRTRTSLTKAYALSTREVHCPVGQRCESFVAARCSVHGSRLHSMRPSELRLPYTDGYGVMKVQTPIISLGLIYSRRVGCCIRLARPNEHHPKAETP
eukprot:5206157-Prymnesium_polylepis.1